MLLRSLALALTLTAFAALPVQAQIMTPPKLSGPATPASGAPQAPGTGPVQAPPVETGPMDMDKSVQRALVANPQIQSAKLQIYGATEGVRAAAANFAPVGTVNWTSNYTNSKVPTTVQQNVNGTTVNGISNRWGEGYLVQLDLNVQQPLFTGFRLLSSFQRARLAQDQAEALYRRAELTLIRSVQTAYLTLLKSRADVKSNQDSVARLQSQYKVTRAFYDVGLRPRLDVLQAESDLASAEQSLLAAQNSVDIQLAQLNALLNIALEQQMDYTGELNQIPFSLTLQQALDEAYRQRPDIAIALKSVEIAGKDSIIALSKALPQVTANYDYIRQGDKFDFRDRNVGYSERHQFQLNLSWQAWDWGSTIFSYRQASDNTKKLQADLARLRLDVGAEVKTQYLNIQDAAKRINVAKVGLNAANEGYRMAVARYQAQVGTNTDVLDAQSRVSRAEFQLTQALTDYQIAIANLFYSIGRKNANLTM